MLRLTALTMAVFSILGLGLVGCSPCSSGSDDDIAQCLAGKAKEDIKQIPRVKDYLSKHKVYVSMTTSPKRIGKIIFVLKTLNLDLIEKIYIALPLKYRDSEDYVIPDELKNFPKVEILQKGEDLGPIMKLLPVVKLAKELGDNDAIVVTVDDDTGYHPDLLGQLIKKAVTHNTVVGAKGVNIDTWKIDRSFWPQLPARGAGCYSGFDLSYCDVLEGYWSIAYPVKWVDVELLTALSKVSKSCKMSDDIVISYGLALSGSPRAIATDVPFADGIVQFGYGFEEDALHFGSGYIDVLWPFSSPAARYTDCVHQMNAWVNTTQK